MNFDTIESAIEDIKIGKMVIVLDDEDRENEGDFIMAAEHATPEAVNFMTKYGRGIICTPITAQRAIDLELPLMVGVSNQSVHETAFTVSIDLVGTGTGVSAEARSQTICSLIEKSTSPADLLRPGHIFPLIAKDGGVLRRAGHTEAAVDLASLAGLHPTGVICEIMDDDGEMARAPKLFEMAKKFNLKIITIKDLIQYRNLNHNNKIDHNEDMVKLTSKIPFPNKYGEWDLAMFESTVKDSEHHVALVKGEISPDEVTLVRVHSECFTGDIFGSRRCDCGEQLDASMKLIEEKGSGVLVYMRQEGRGIGLPNKIKAYNLQDQGLDTVQANHKLGFKSDLREYGIGAQILKLLGVTKMSLLTNNPKKIVGLEAFNLEVVNRCPIETQANETNLDYLQTKKEKMGHIFDYLQ